MQSHRNSVLSRSMAVVPGATISIYDAGTSNLSTIYSDNGVTAASNPLTSDADGEFEFWAADGRYDVTTTYSGQTDSYEIVLFDPIGGGSTTDISIGPTATPALYLDVSANHLQIGKNLTTEQATIELGRGRTGNGNAVIDLIGDATYTDYGLRLRRYDTGANASSALLHRGTGVLYLRAEDAGSIQLETNSTIALTVDSSQKTGFGISTPDSKVHIWKASAGTVTAATNTVLTIENNTSAYINILTPNTSTGGILFGDTDANNSAGIQHNHSTDEMSFILGITSLRLDKNATAGNTRMLIYDVDNATLERVSVGAADSGGAGYKVLRIPN